MEIPSELNICFDRFFFVIGSFLLIGSILLVCLLHFGMSAPSKAPVLPMQPFKPVQECCIFYTYACLDVDHNAFIRPTLQAICGLADMILSTNGQLKSEIPSKPFFRTQQLDIMVAEVQSQIQLLVEDQRIELSIVMLCLSKMFIDLVKLA